MGENKIYSREEVTELFIAFYNKVKHGDQEHQTWLFNETVEFIKEKITNGK